MRRMYTECGLVHADLSEYNLLWYEGRIHVIDVSQSVEPTHENAHGFLLRDCSNMSDFFSKAGVADVMTPHQLFNFTTGMDIQATSEAEFMLEASVCIVPTSVVENIVVFLLLTTPHIAHYVITLWPHYLCLHYSN